MRKGGGGRSAGRSTGCDARSSSLQRMVSRCGRYEHASRLRLLRDAVAKESASNAPTLGSGTVETCMAMPSPVSGESDAQRISVKLPEKSSEPLASSGETPAHVPRIVVEVTVKSPSLLSNENEIGPLPLKKLSVFGPSWARWSTGFRTGCENCIVKLDAVPRLMESVRAIFGEKYVAANANDVESSVAPIRPPLPIPPGPEMAWSVVSVTEAVPKRPVADSAKKSAAVQSTNVAEEAVETA